MLHVKTLLVLTAVIVITDTVAMDLNVRMSMNVLRIPVHQMASAQIQSGPLSVLVTMVSEARASTVKMLTSVCPMSAPKMHRVIT